MQRKSLSLFSFVALALILIGCNRGCTTAKTIASESTIVSTGGGDLEFTGRVVDYRHSQRQSADVFDRKVSHSYGLSFDIKFGTFVERNAFTEGVKDPDVVKLKEEMKRAKFAVSKDKNHIAMGVDGKVVRLIHLYKSNRIQTNQPKLLADGTMDWSKLDIESYPSPGSILTESLKNSCEDIGSDRESMFEYCDSRKPTDKVHKVMLDKWPDCNLAKAYLSEERIGLLSKNKKWRKIAEKRGEKVLESPGLSNFEFDEVLTFVEALNSDKLTAKLDTLLIAGWGRNTSPDYTEALSKRIESKTNPLDKSGRLKVYNQAKEGFAEFERTGQSSYKREAPKCLQMLCTLGDTMTGFRFVQNSFGSSISKFKPRDFLDATFDNFGAYTDYQQQLIIQKAEPSFAYFKNTFRSVYFSSIGDLVDCSMLKRLQKRYPNDLEHSMLPTRCEP